MTRTETVLGWGQEMILGEVIVELLVYSPLYNFGEDGKDGDWPEVGWIRGIAGFVNRIDKGMFPGFGDVGIG